MKNKKGLMIAILFIFLVISVAFQSVVFVNGGSTLMYQTGQPTAISIGGISTNYLSGSRLLNTSCNNQPLDMISINFQILRNNTYIRLAIYELNSSAMIPANAEPLEMSTNYLHWLTASAPTYNDTNYWQPFYFSDTLILNSSSYGYAIMLNRTTTMTDTINIGAYSNANYYSGQSPIGAAGLGFTPTTNAISYQVYTYTGPTPEPTYPLPTGGSYGPINIDQLIDTFAGYLVPLVLFLLPAFLLGFVTKWQKWPILIGLAIGSGLTYLFLGVAYVWLVFLVVIGMVGMAYQSMRGGGDHK